MALIPQVVVTKKHDIPGATNPLLLCVTIYYDTLKSEDEAYVVMEGRSHVMPKISLSWEDFQKRRSLDKTEIPSDIKYKVEETFTIMEQAVREYEPPKNKTGEEKKRTFQGLKEYLDHRH